MRPLISTGDRGKSVDISRKAELYETSSGMITITGGKLTTWRRMAKQTVDRIVERDGNDARCITHELPLGMAVAPDDLTAAPEWAREQLAGRYGHIAHEVLRERPARSGSSPAARTCWPRSCTRCGASRRAPSGTCCCAARASA